jgi:long-chain fatty acid transport protein
LDALKGNKMIKGISKIAAVSVLSLLSSNLFASDFSLPFVNASGLGEAYADWASGAFDASTSYTNPAGLTKLKHQQLSFALLGVQGSSQFTGTAITPPFPFSSSITQTGSASSYIGAYLPSFYYAAPINNRYTFGFNQTQPFGLGTNYATDSIVRYAATRSKILVVDVGPSLGVKITDKLALGAGIDIERLFFTLNYMYGPPVSLPADSESQNHIFGWGYGWHGGILYDFLPTTRVGLSHQSMVMFHGSGNSQVYGTAGAYRTNELVSNAALPARTQLSVHHDFNSQWTGMVSAFYENWSTLQQITLKKSILPGGAITNFTIPLNYHNTFDYNVGINFKPNEKWILRTGLAFVNTPTNSRDRGVADPIGASTVVALGAHYQQNKCLGYDAGFSHSFFRQESVNLHSPLTTLIGHNQPQTSTYGLQVTWNLV